MIKKIYKALLPLKLRNQIRRSVRKSFSFLHSGDAFYCVCCDRAFDKFLTKGNTPRPNAECPHCGSLERVRLLDLYLEQELKLYESSGLCILHIAPEACLKKKISSTKNVTYIDGDLNPANADHIVDLTDIHFPDNHFDLILCSHVLGHIPDEAKAISEMYRVLKKGGTALVMSLINLEAQKTFEDAAITTAEARLRTYGEPDLFRLHGLDLDKRIRASGFTVEKIDYRLEFSEAEKKRMQLGDGQRELIFRCTR